MQNSKSIKMKSDCCGADYTTGEGWIGKQVGIIYVCKKCHYQCTPIEEKPKEGK